MNKKKRIKELEERIVQLEQRIEILDAPLAECWQSLEPHIPRPPYYTFTLAEVSSADKLEK